MSRFDHSLMSVWCAMGVGYFLYVDQISAAAAFCAAAAVHRAAADILKALGK